MFIELIDDLRCPRPHEDSPLVASVSTMVGRDIERGALGCPVCGAEYPIENGIAIFGSGQRISAPDSGLGEREGIEEAALRCAALLDLRDPGGYVILVGQWGRVGKALLDLARVLVLVVDPALGIIAAGGVSAIVAGDRLPVAAGSARGVALDRADVSEAFLESAARSLRPRGRLLAPVGTPVPRALVERARDERYWLGEAATPQAGEPPVRLRRAR